MTVSISAIFRLARARTAQPCARSFLGGLGRPCRCHPRQVDVSRMTSHGICFPMCGANLGSGFKALTALRSSPQNNVYSRAECEVAEFLSGMNTMPTARLTTPPDSLHLYRQIVVAVTTREQERRDVQSTGKSGRHYRGVERHRPCDRQALRRRRRLFFHHGPLTRRA